MAAKAKRLIEVLLVKCELTGIPEKGLPKSRNLGVVDMIWPRASIAKKSAAREFVFAKGVADFTKDPWAKRVLLREEVEDHTALAVSITEPVSIQKIRRFLRLTVKYALKQGADMVEHALVGYGDIASSPVDALAAMAGETDAPKVIAQGVLDIPHLPVADQEVYLTVPLYRTTRTKRAVGSLMLAIRG